MISRAAPGPGRAGRPYTDPGPTDAIADRVPGAQFVELPGGDQALSAMDLDLVADHIEEFVLGARVGRHRDRNFATVLFTDIVGSTKRAADMGDSRWRALLGDHDSLTRREVERHRGRYVKSTGDGVLATFPLPLDQQERSALQRSAQIVRQAIDQLAI